MYKHHPYQKLKKTQRTFWHDVSNLGSPRPRYLYNQHSWHPIQIIGFRADDHLPPPCRKELFDRIEERWIRWQKLHQHPWTGSEPLPASDSSPASLFSVHSPPSRRPTTTHTNISSCRTLEAFLSLQYYVKPMRSVEPLERPTPFEYWVLSIQHFDRMEKHFALAEALLLTLIMLMLSFVQTRCLLYVAFCMELFIKCTSAAFRMVNVYSQLRRKQPVLPRMSKWNEIASVLWQVRSVFCILCAHNENWKYRIGQLHSWCGILRRCFKKWG